LEVVPRTGIQCGSIKELRVCIVKVQIHFGVWNHVKDVEFDSDDLFLQAEVCNRKGVHLSELFADSDIATEPCRNEYSSSFRNGLSFGSQLN
jgi:hypothetical protein